MSRRGLVLEGYQAPSGSKEVNPMEAQQLVAQERMRNQSLAAQKQKSNAANTNDTFEYIEKNYKPNTDKTNSNVIQQKADEEMNGIYNDAFTYLKKNPNATKFEIASLFGGRAFNTNQLYTKGKLLRENADKAALEISKMDAGVNPTELSVEAQKQAFLDPETGKVREDLTSVDPNDYGKYMDEAISNKALHVLSNKGLENHVYNKDAIKTDELTTVYQDKNKGIVKEKVSVAIPQDYELEKNDKGFNVVNKEGFYSVVPKSETLPDGSKILDKDVFNRLPKSAQERARAEAKIGIKAFNMANGTNIHQDSFEADTIARKFAYEDMAKIWNNGGVKRLIEKKEPPAPRITINTGGGKDNKSVEYNDTWGRIRDKYLQSKEEKLNSDIDESTKSNIAGNNFVISMNQLDTDAINLISGQVNGTRKEDDKISPDMMYVHYSDNGGVKVYKAEEKEDGSKMAYLDDKHLIATLPPSANLKTSQANSKAKVAAQNEAKDREKGGQSDGKHKKTVKLSTLKSLIGTKGYEGVSEKELVDYYKSNGYDIK